ncbi:MAG: YkvA family protein [Arcicella sp.]|nr:YkvA family protein [Arcicella sp.]
MNKEDLITKVLKSIFFKSATKRAGKFAGKGLAILELLREALVKAKDIGDKQNKGVGTVLSEKVTTLARMIKSYVSGDYKIIPWASIVKMIAVLLYFVSPIDLIPDFIPVLGLTDDFALIMWLFSSLADDFENFEAWEKGKL